jgi:isocitrate/isopropylmalate dehydrogenase
VTAQKQYHTRDLAGVASTSQVTQAVIEALGHVG